ncbi:hypothetical protein TR13x_06110 [Caloranaerobacter sp. TR13]|uniref:hypothetical protein n=1 Tax=Caloranaerobacter sp. TR13 TaxID=1302151 RepID=UPI0006D41079|nr:hypothetical protein [Caloranaerobacter sp. TR13]KPU27314.1 hypothetical protein TR13x_06110 [Caloranaerobacter sp. TR13]
MRVFEFIIYLILTILDTMISINYFFFRNIAFSTLVVLHIVFVCILFILSKKVFKDSKALPFYIALFLPGIGMIFITTINIMLESYAKKNGLIKEYEKYVHYKNELENIKKININKELNLLSMYDKLKYSPSSEKKEAIIELIDNDMEIKVYILRTALLDEDPEVVHYAASTLNLFEQEYERNLFILKQKYIQSNEVNTLVEIIELYDSYINSGLLDDESLKIYLKEYLNLLEDNIDRFNDNYEILLKMIDINIKLSKFDDCFYLIKRLFENFSPKFETYFYLMKIYYNLKNYKMVSNIAKKIRELEIKIPEKYEGIINYWL